MASSLSEARPLRPATIWSAWRLALPPITVFFSPRGGCTDAITAELGHATNSVLVQAYSFTSVPIAKALVDAHKRGVKIEVVLDKSQRTEKYSSATFVFNAGIPTFIDASHAIAHNKIIIIDRATVITGSFNFSKAAEESNAKNLLVIHDRALAVGPPTRPTPPPTFTMGGNGKCAFRWGGTPTP